MPTKDSDLPFPIRGVSRSLSHTKANPETTPDANNVLPYDPLEHRYRGGSRPGFRDMSWVNVGGPPVFMVSFPGPPVDGEPFRLSLVAGTANDVFVNKTGQATVGDTATYTETLVSLTSPLTTEESASGGPFSYLAPGGNDVYVQPDATDYYRPGFGTGTGVTILTEAGDEIQAASFSFGGKRTYATPYQGGVVVTGTGQVIKTGVGTLSGGKFIGDDIGSWSSLGVIPHQHLLEITPLNEAAEATVGFASYLIHNDISEELFVDSGSHHGRCSFRVVDGPKLISARNRSVTSISSSIGHVPIGADTVSTYLDRLVFTKDRVWYMSRQGDPTDYDYGADATDRGRAVAGVSSNAGLPGDPIVALASRGNDYLVMFARKTTWVMRGDPAAGGTLFNLSRSYGCVDPQAWCHGDGGEIYFLSKEGMCIVPDQAGARPEPVSAASLPNELRNFDANNSHVSLAFDVRYRGVWIFLTPRVGENSIHWFYSKLTDSFWPIRLSNTNHQPTAAVAHTSSPAVDTAVVIGGRDGTLRRAVPGLGDTDAGLESSLVLGPYLAGDTTFQEAILTRLLLMMGGEGAPIAVRVFSGKTPEEAADKAVANVSPSYTAAITGNRSKVLIPRVRSVAFCVRLSSTSPWAFESLVASVGAAGIARA